MHSTVKAYAPLVVFALFLGALLFALPTMAYALDDAALFDDNKSHVDGVGAGGEPSVPSSGSDLSEATFAPSVGVNTQDSETPGNSTTGNIAPNTSTDGKNVSDAEESEEPQAPEDGTYAIESAIDTSKVLDAKNGSTDNCTQVQSYGSNGTDAQVWRIETSDDGYSTIYHAASGKALDVAEANVYSGAKIQLYDPNGTLAQKWVITPEGKFCKIASALNLSYVLDLAGASLANGTVIQLWIDNGTMAQRWSLSFAETIRQRADRLALENIDVLADGTYSIETLLSPGKVIDIPSGSANMGATLQTYDSNETSAQVWTVSHDENGYVTLINTDSGLALDVPSANASARVAVQLWRSNGTWAQKWIAVATENGFKLLSAIDSRYALDVSHGNNENGALLWLYADNGTDAQRWGAAAMQSPVMKLDELAKNNEGAISDGVYAIRSELLIKLVLDARYAGTDNGTVVQTYTANDTAAQWWSVSHDSKGYITLINVNSGKALDVKSGNASSGTKVQLHTPNGTNAQKWIAVPCGKAFALISALSINLALDVESGEIANSTAVQIWNSNDTTAQHWYFTKASKDEVTVSLNCGDNAILPIELGFGDYALTLPSYATGGNTYLSLDKDTVIGANGSVVSGGTQFSIADYFSEAIDSIVYFVVNDLAGNALSNLYILKSANLTSIFVASEDSEEHGRIWVESSADHSNSAKGTIDVVASDGTSIYDGKLSQIKGRGNTSWWCFYKKPYQIKLDKKADLLQTGDKSNKAKTWVLISDGFDWSSSKNLIAYSYAKLMGVSSAIDCAMVDLYYDGEYRGTYLLCEKVQIGSGRVDIEDLEETIEDLNPDIDDAEVVLGTNSYGMTISYGKDLNDPADISGGYLIEYDARYASESSYFSVWDGAAYQYFVCKSPEVWSYEQADYMSCLIQDLFDAFNNNGVVPSWRGSSRAGMTTDELLDVNSLARLYWVNELLKNTDGLKYSSTFLYKDADSGDGASLIFFGPAWDFDLSCGTGEANPNTNGWYTRVQGLSSSYMNDSYVTKAIEDEKVSAIQILRDYLNEGAFGDAMGACQASFKMNDLVWGLKSAFSMSDSDIAAYYLYDWNVDKTCEEVAEWINERIDWIEAN